MALKDSQQPADPFRWKNGYTSHTGWREPYAARLQVSACKTRKKTFPLGHCRSCKGLVPAATDGINAMAA